MEKARADYLGAGIREVPSQDDREGVAGEAGGGGNTRGRCHHPQNRLQRERDHLCPMLLRGHLEGRWAPGSLTNWK